MKRSVIFFDLDDTLYSSESGLWNALRERIDQYIGLKLNIPHSDIPSFRQDLFLRYGTTLRGLQNEFNIDSTDYLDFVHDVEISKYISVDMDIISTIKNLNFRKFIFSNADEAHVKRILCVLQLEPYFESIIDIVKLNPFCKPNPESFEIALRLANAIPTDCILIDDSIPNLAAADGLGILPILISQDRSNQEDYHQIRSLIELPVLLNRLLK